MNLCKRKYLLSSMMSAYSVVKAGRNEVTSRSLGCLGPPLPDPVEPRIGLPPETYEAVRQLRISDIIEYFFFHFYAVLLVVRQQVSQRKYLDYTLKTSVKGMRTNFLTFFTFPCPLFLVKIACNYSILQEYIDVSKHQYSLRQL